MEYTKEYLIELINSNPITIFDLKLFIKIYKEIKIDKYEFIRNFLPYSNNRHLINGLIYKLDECEYKAICQKKIKIDDIAGDIKINKNEIIDVMQLGRDFAMIINKDKNYTIHIEDFYLHFILLN